MFMFTFTHNVSDALCSEVLGYVLSTQHAKRGTYLPEIQHLTLYMASGNVYSMRELMFFFFVI